MASKRFNVTWRRRSLLIAAPVVIVMLVQAAVSLFGPRPHQLTDDRAIEMPEARAELRLVLWAPPRPLDPIFNTHAEESHPAVSRLGNEQYFARHNGDGNAELFVSHLRGEKWTPPIPLSAVNSKHNERSPCLSADANWLLFSSDRPGGKGGYDLYACKRTRGGWSAPINLGPAVNSPSHEIDPALSPDQMRLCFASDRLAGDVVSSGEKKQPPSLSERNFDLYTAQLNDPPGKPKWHRSIEPAQPMATLNSAAFDGSPCFSPADDFLYFASGRIGGQGRLDLYRSRLTGGKPATPKNLGPQINSPTDETDPCLTIEGFSLLFASNRPAPDAPDGAPLQFDLYRAQSHEVYARPMDRSFPLAPWAWWALAGGLALLVALALYIHEGGYRRLDLLKKCMLFSLLLHVVVSVLLSLVMVSQQIVEIVAPDAGMTTAVNLDIAREVEIRLQTRQTLTDMPTETPQINPTSMRRVVVYRTRPEQIPTVVLPPTQRVEGRMVIQPEAPSRLPAHSIEAVALRELDFFAASPQPTPPITKPLRAAEPVSEQAVQTPKPRATPSIAQPLAEARPRLHSTSVEPTQPRRLALLPSASGDRPPTKPNEDVKPDADLSAVQPLLTQPAADVAAVTSDEAKWPQRTEPATPSQPLAARPEREQHSRQNPGQAPATRASEKSILLAQAVTPRLDVPIETREVALPESSVGPRLQVPQLAQVKQAEPPATPRNPVDSPDTVQPLPSSEQSLAAAEINTPDLQMLKPMRAEEAPLPHRADALVMKPADPALAMEPAVPALVTYPITADLGPSRLSSPASLFQRSVMQRQRLLREMGGTHLSEQAVERALRFLARLQEDDGRWTHIENQAAPTGKGRGDHDSAITGLAALCFLASEHTPEKTGPFQQTITKALDFLMDIQKSNGDLRDRDERYGMYCHAIATLALAEAAVMTDRRDYRDAALRGAQFIIEAQHQPTGGWRYKPNQAGDTSVFGWQIMALHSCEQLGLRIPAETREGAMRWLVRVSENEHDILSGYQNDNPTRPMTAEAVFSRLLLDEDISPQRRQVAADYLLKDMPSQQRGINFYYWYYGSLAMMQLGGKEWRQWNQQTRQTLLQMQHTSGPLVGSWDFKPSKWGERGGRIYSTALATLTCQVYYRYLPMYKYRPIRR